MIARLKRLGEHYESYGMRRTCEGILVCHEHNHPHVLMLQIANAFFKLCVFDVHRPSRCLTDAGRQPRRLLAPRRGRNRGLQGSSER